MMKLLSILVIFLFILGLKAQDAESTYSRKLVHNNAKDGFFHSIIGEIDGNVLVCFKNIKYWQKNQKYKIIKFDKNLSVVKKYELNGYPINNTDNKDIENSRKLTYVKSIILKDRIFIFWEKRIKYSTYFWTTIIVSAPLGFMIYYFGEIVLNTPVILVLSVVLIIPLVFWYKRNKEVTSQQLSLHVDYKVGNMKLSHSFQFVKSGHFGEK